MPTILHAIPSLEGGGAERQLSMLAVEQVRRGWVVHVALRRGGIYEERMRGGGVVLHRLGDLRSIHPLLVARLGSLMRRTRPDLIQTWLPQMDIVGALATIGARVPWVMSERTTAEAYREIHTQAWLRARLGHRARAIVTNSIEGARYWERVRPAVPHVATVANAIDLAAIRQAAPAEPPPGTGPLLLFVGRLHKVKAPEIFVRALARIPDVRAMIIGDGPLRDDVARLVDELGVRSRVSIVAYRTSWWGLLAHATALVSTSRFEGHPNVVLEAMAAGCPLIATDIPAHRELLDEDSALLVPRDDPSAVSDAIVRTLADPDAVRERAERASQRVAGFTIERAADAYERVYARVLNGRSH
jgi:glycosyltransferase involved in cell wall biosynthesis